MDPLESIAEKFRSLQDEKRKLQEQLEQKDRELKDAAIVLGLARADTDKAREFEKLIGYVVKHGDKPPIAESDQGQVTLYGDGLPTRETIIARVKEWREFFRFHHDTAEPIKLPDADSAARVIIDLIFPESSEDLDYMPCRAAASASIVSRAGEGWEITDGWLFSEAAAALADAALATVSRNAVTAAFNQALQAADARRARQAKLSGQTLLRVGRTVREASPATIVLSPAAMSRILSGEGD